MSRQSSLVDVLRATQAWGELRGAWDDIVALQSAGIQDLDITAGLDWAMTLWETHLTAGEIEVLVVREGTHISGILPLYRSAKRIRRIPCRNLSQLPELYSGRAGLLLRDARPEALQQMFTHLHTHTPGWDVFTITLLRGSVQEKLFIEFAAANGLAARIIEEQFSPYIFLKGTWEQHFASLPKKLRSTIRNGEKRLRERGELTYRECRTPQEAEIFNSAVEEIERDSWKEAAGTSIASNRVHEAFHRAITIRAAKGGFFSGHLLLHGQQPIAYVMGLLYNGVFLDLKESYRNTFRETSPAHVLKSYLFTRLYEQQATLFDFMGKCEEYKMKWTDKTYCRSTYLLFNNTARGKLARWVGSLGNPLRKSDAPVHQDVAVTGDGAGPQHGTEHQPGSVRIAGGAVKV
jgi:hypothetical protein